MRKIIQMFEDGNVCVVGLRGRGKDMLMANVVMRRKKPYISNTNYGGQWLPFKPKDFTCGGNSYKDFLEGTVKHYEWPYGDGVDVYASDLGVYTPAQYCNELNKAYPGIPVYMALSRQIADANFHCNCQNLNRIWDKIREQSDMYIMCNWCKVLFGKIVLQKVTIYELYEAAVKRVPPFRLPMPLFNPERQFTWRIQKESYLINYGYIKPRFLLYINRSNYDTRIFKEILRNGKREDKKVC